MSEDSGDFPTADAADTWLKGQREQVLPKDSEKLYGLCGSIIDMANQIRKEKAYLEAHLESKFGITFEEVSYDPTEIIEIESDFRDEPFRQSLLKLGNEEVENVTVKDAQVYFGSDVVKAIGLTKAYAIQLNLGKKIGDSEDDYRATTYFIGENGTIAKEEYTDLDRDEDANSKMTVLISGGEVELLQTLTAAINEKLGSVISEEDETA